MVPGGVGPIAGRAVTDPPGAVVADQRLVLVEDHVIFAEGLRSLLEAESFGEVVHAATLREAAQLLDAGCDLLILDVSLPDGSGLALLEQLEREGRRPRTLVLTAHDDVHTTTRAVQAGANGVLSKRVPTGEVLDAARRVMAGGASVPEDQLGAVLEALRSGAPKSHPSDAPGLHRLSGRERQVLQCLVDGMGRAAIAEELYVSVNTVRTHIRRILQKLEVHSQLEAVRAARSSGLLPRHGA